MNSEQTFFLQTLKDHINGRETRVPADVDLNRVEQYALDHQVEPLFFYQTQENVFRNGYYSQLIVYEHRASIMEELERRLTDIPHFIVKGPFAAQYYPVKELRTMGDTDIVVKPEDRDRADRKLRDYGFEIVNKTSGEWEYGYKGILIELHTALFYKYSDSVMVQKQVDYFGRCWDYYRDGQIDLNFHILFLFMHLRKHIMEMGVGFRQFLDIAAVMKSADADWDKIMADAKLIGLDQFVRTAAELTEKWFGVRSPYGSGLIDEAFFEKATLTIFDDGVFGFSNNKNLYNETVNKWKKTGKRFNRIDVFFKHLFWPYGKMIDLPEYEWLEGRKYLLPLAWAERAVTKLRYWNELKYRYYASDRIANERLEYLGKWGIEEGEESE